jgi:type II secretory pathway component PulC
MITNLYTEQRALLGACLLSAGLVAFTGIYTLTQWVGDWTLAHPQPANKPAIAATNESAALIAAIPDAHLFGKSFSDTGNVPITSLQLRVTGIVDIDDGEGGSASKAYISIAGAPSKIYQVGDSLPYGVKLYSISADTVMLENDGKLEKLPLPREPLAFKPRDTEESADE